MYTVEATVAFEAAHRLYGVDTYSKECRDSIHGHSYKVKTKIGRKQLNGAGMVIDFKLLKEIMGLIDRQYDHSLILRDIDPLVPDFRRTAPEQKLNIVSESPTAEWMAESFYYRLAEEFHVIDPELVILYVSVQETEKNIATYSM